MFNVIQSEHLHLWNLPSKCFEFRITSGSPVYELFPSFKFKEQFKLGPNHTCTRSAWKCKGNHRQYYCLTIWKKLVGLTNGISVSEDKIQISLLILRQGALSRNSFSVTTGIGTTDINSIAYIVGWCKFFFGFRPLCFACAFLWTSWFFFFKFQFPVRPVCSVSSVGPSFKNSTYSIKNPKFGQGKGQFWR